MTRYDRFVNFVRIVSIFGAIFLVDALLQKLQNLNLSPFLAITFPASRLLQYFTLLSSSVLGCSTPALWFEN